jgi:hypothetical protein
MAFGEGCSRGDWSTSSAYPLRPLYLHYLLAYIIGFRAMIRGADLDDEDFGEDDHDEWCEMMVHLEEDEGIKITGNRVLISDTNRRIFESAGFLR